MLTVKYAVQLEVTDGNLVNFKSPSIAANSTTEFDEELGATLIIPDTTVDMNVGNAALELYQMLFLMSDKALDVKLVPQGYLLADTPPLKLLPNKPTLISVSNIIEIYVSNTTGQQGKLTMQAIGTNLP